MIFMMDEERMKRLAKRLRKVLRDLGIELKNTDALKLAVRLCGFDDWRTTSIAIRMRHSGSSTNIKRPRAMTDRVERVRHSKIFLSHPSIQSGA